MISCDKFYTQYARTYYYFLMWADVDRSIFDAYGISKKEVIVEIIIQLEIYLDILRMIPLVWIKYVPTKASLNLISSVNKSS